MTQNNRQVVIAVKVRLACPRPRIRRPVRGNIALITTLPTLGCQFLGVTSARRRLGRQASSSYVNTLNEETFKGLSTSQLSVSLRCLHRPLITSLSLCRGLAERGLSLAPKTQLKKIQRNDTCFSSLASFRYYRPSYRSFETQLLLSE